MYLLDKQLASKLFLQWCDEGRHGDCRWQHVVLGERSNVAQREADKQLHVVHGGIRRKIRLDDKQGNRCFVKHGFLHAPPFHRELRFDFNLSDFAFREWNALRRTRLQRVGQRVMLVRLRILDRKRIHFADERRKLHLRKQLGEHQRNDCRAHKGRVVQHHGIDLHNLDLHSRPSDVGQCVHRLFRHDEQNARAGNDLHVLLRVVKGGL